MVAKYQFMETNLQRRVAGLRDKMPDIQKTLDTVRFLKIRDEDVETTFELNDTLYAKAKIPPTDEVYLWLGANVMLSYPIDEAVELLESKLKAAKTSLGNCEEDLDFLREQITVRLSVFFPLWEGAGPANLDIGGLTRDITDYGGCGGQSLQLGCGAKTQGEGRRGERQGKREQGRGYTDWLRKTERTIIETNFTATNVGRHMSVWTPGRPVRMPACRERGTEGRKVRCSVPVITNRFGLFFWYGRWDKALCKAT